MISLMASNESMPVNIGNPEEYTIRDFADVVLEHAEGSKSQIVHMPPAADDPLQRRPNITKAAEVLEWRPKFGMR